MNNQNNGVTNVRVSSGKVTTLLDTRDTQKQPEGHYKDSPFSFFQASVFGEGEVRANIVIRGSNDGKIWGKTPLVSFNLSGDAIDSDVASYTGPAKYVRADVYDLNDIATNVIVTMCV